MKLRLHLLLPLLALGTGPLAASTAESERALAGPALVETLDGRTLRGVPIAYRDGIFTLRDSIDGGEVERGIHRRDIARIQFPGAAVERLASGLVSEGDFETALPHLEAIWRRRAPFLALLEVETIALLSELPVAHRMSGDPFRAIGVARQLRPFAQGSAADLLDEAILLAHLDLQFHEEANDLARAWIEAREKPAESALGWRVLAELALTRGDLDRVLWSTLPPIAFAGAPATPHLEWCYALGAHAYLLLEEPARAHALYEEMRRHGYTWPEDPRLAATAAAMREMSGERENPAETGATAEIDQRPPEEDLHLPMRAVRKLLHHRDD